MVSLIVMDLCSLLFKYDCNTVHLKDLYNSFLEYSIPNTSIVPQATGSIIDILRKLISRLRRIEIIFNSCRMNIAIRDTSSNIQKMIHMLETIPFNNLAVMLIDVAEHGWSSWDESNGLIDDSNLIFLVHITFWVDILVCIILMYFELSSTTMSQKIDLSRRCKKRAVSELKWIEERAFKVAGLYRLFGSDIGSITGPDERLEWLSSPFGIQILLPYVAEDQANAVKRMKDVAMSYMQNVNEMRCSNNDNTIANMSKGLKTFDGTFFSLLTL